MHRRSRPHAASAAVITALCALLAAALGAQSVWCADTSTSKPARDAAQIFITTCGWCHHKGGREAGKGPQLMGSALTDEQIAQRIRKGKQGFMPAFEDTFSEDEIRALVTYIRELKPR